MKDIFEELDNMSDDELLEEMNSILEEVKENETVTDFDAPDFLRDSIFSEIREIEEREAREKLSAEDKRLLEYGRRYKRQLKFRKYWILAAALVLMFAMGITSVGGPQRFIKRMIGTISGRDQEMVDSSEGIILSKDWDEDAAYEEIEEKYGFRPVKLDHLPEGVVFERAEINEERQDAILFFTKNEALCIQYVVKTNYRDGSMGIDIEDELLEEYQIQNEGAEIIVRCYKVESGNKIRYVAMFVYNNTAYYITALDVENEVFNSILQNIKF